MHQGSARIPLGTITGSAKGFFIYKLLATYFHTLMHITVQLDLVFFKLDLFKILVKKGKGESRYLSVLVSTGL